VKRLICYALFFGALTGATVPLWANSGDLWNPVFDSYKGTFSYSLDEMPLHGVTVSVEKIVWGQRKGMVSGLLGGNNEYPGVLGFAVKIDNQSGSPIVVDWNYSSLNGNRVFLDHEKFSEFDSAFLPVVIPDKWAIVRSIASEFSFVGALSDVGLAPIMGTEFAIVLSITKEKEQYFSTTRISIKPDQK